MSATFFKISIIVLNAILITTWFLIILCFTSNSVAKWFFKKYRDTEETKKLMLESAKFYGKELGLSDDMNINIEYSWAKWYCFIHGYIKKESGDNNYSIHIYLNHNKFSLLNTMAHEMIHAKQFYKGELSVDGNKRFWFGVDHTDTPYEDKPWEIEAFEGSKVLSDKFIKHKNMKKPFIVSMIDKLPD